RPWLHTNLCRRLERNKAVAQIVQRSARGLKALRKRIEDFGDIVFVSKAMVARGAKARAADLLVISYVRRAFPFRPHANAVRKDAGQKERIIAHVGADEKAGEVVGRLQGGEHINKVIHRLALGTYSHLRAMGL